MRDVIDPELGINVVDLGLLYGVHVADDNAVTLDMTLTSAACPLTDVIEDQTNSALAGLVKETKINWVWMPPWGPDKITDEGREQLRAHRLQRLTHPVAPLADDRGRADLVLEQVEGVAPDVVPRVDPGEAVGADRLGVHVERRVDDLRQGCLRRGHGSRTTSRGRSQRMAPTLASGTDISTCLACHDAATFRHPLRRRCCSC